MRVLVTGVSGQVGGALVARLQAGAALLAADRTVLDLAAPHAIPAVLDRLAPDIILNPAAYTAVDKAEDEPALAMRVNAQAPGAIARWAAARGVPLIHFSTDYVFDGSGQRPWRTPLRVRHANAPSCASSPTRSVRRHRRRSSPMR